MHRRRHQNGWRLCRHMVNKRAADGPTRNTHALPVCSDTAGFREQISVKVKSASFRTRRPARNERDQALSNCCDSTAGFCVDGLVPEPRRSRAPLAGKLALVCHVLFLLMLRM